MSLLLYFNSFQFGPSCLRVSAVAKESREQQQSLPPPAANSCRSRSSSTCDLCSTPLLVLLDIISTPIMAPSKKAKKPKKNLELDLPFSVLTLAQINTRIWTEGKPKKPNCFYDVPVRDVTKKLTSYPPHGLDLSDAWVVAILNCTTKRIRRSILSSEKDIDCKIIIRSGKTAQTEYLVRSRRMIESFWTRNVKRSDPTSRILCEIRRARFDDLLKM